MADYNLKHRDKLLADIVSGMRDLHPRQWQHVTVVFEVGEDTTYSFDFVVALGTISNDLFWDERGNWAEAHSARCVVR